MERRVVVTPRKAKPQITIVVVRSLKKRATWELRISSSGFSVLLPGDFITKNLAAYLVQELADAYRESGYEVAIDYSGRH